MTTENTKRSKGTITSAGNSGTVGVGEVNTVEEPDVDSVGLIVGEEVTVDCCMFVVFVMVTSSK